MTFGKVTFLTSGDYKIKKSCFNITEELSLKIVFCELTIKQNERYRKNLNYQKK